MSPHENASILDLTTEVKAMRSELAEQRADLKVIHTKLFGDDESENEEGRLPRVEKKVVRIERKLRRWDPIHTILRGAWLLLVAAAGYFVKEYWPRGH